MQRCIIRLIRQATVLLFVCRMCTHTPVSSRPPCVLLQLPATHSGHHTLNPLILPTVLSARPDLPVQSHQARDGVRPPGVFALYDQDHNLQYVGFR